jgi:hypothetical protein
MIYIFLPESNICHIELLFVLSFVKGCVHFSLDIFQK